MKTIYYYLSPKSPWTYMGHDRLMAIAAKHHAVVEPRPVDLSEKVFPQSGGLPFNKRPLQRQAYRLIELRRWSDYLGVPLTLQPAYFPVDDRVASLMIVGASMQYDNDAANRLAGGFLRAVWSEEQNLADRDTLVRIADVLGLDGRHLYDHRANAQQTFDLFTQQAIDQQAFGAPWYVYNNEPFWGQDRLDFLDRALAATQS